MKNETFFEVLKSEVRKDLRLELGLELELENQARLERESAPQRFTATTQHEQLGTWLATHLNPHMTPKNRASSQAQTKHYQSNFNPKSQARKTQSSDRSESHSSRTADAPTSERPSPLTVSPTVIQSSVSIEAKHQVRSPSEILALRLLNSTGANLSEVFTKSELKKTWKKAALTAHPDRHLNADPEEVALLNKRFTDLLNAVEILTGCPEISSVAP